VGKVKRALFFDLVDLGEERDVEGVRMFAWSRAAHSLRWRRRTRSRI